jgi:hypothetical protein
MEICSFFRWVLNFLSIIQTSLGLKWLCIYNLASWEEINMSEATLDFGNLEVTIFENKEGNTWNLRLHTYYESLSDTGMELCVTLSSVVSTEGVNEEIMWQTKLH